jgi:RNA polymerase sigma-70 factor (ECF subfamily)
MSISMVPDLGNEQSLTQLERLFREHYALIYRTAYSIAGTRQDAEDALQTIFLRLLQREFPPDLETHARRYFHRAAVNVALTAVRTRKRQRLADGIEGVDLPIPEAPQNENEKIEENLIEAMAQLPPQAVEILILRYEHNYSDAEIATMLGKSRPAIAVALFRARARLRKLMRASLGEDL